MKILLIGNYLPDRQESMLRFADALFAGLKAKGVDAEIIRPPLFFGKIRSGPNGLGKWLGYLDKFLVFPAILKRKAARAAVVHICDHSNAHYTRFLQRIPHLVTCNDLLAVRSALGEFPENPTRWSGRLLQRMIFRGLNRARAITCISEATRKDLLRLTAQKPEAVSVTYMGLNYPYEPRRAPDVLQRYLLHVGGDQWYKNRRGVLAIYQQLRLLLGAECPRLIMVGPGFEEKLPPGVESRSGVGNEELCRLYSNAELLLFPSLEEGFGWPILEAQACGCPVVTTGKAPMTEVGGECAHYLDDPRNSEAAARVVADALNEPPLVRQNRIAAGIANAARFSTQQMVDGYLSIYQGLCRA